MFILTMFNIVFMIGIILICEGITIKFSGRSIIHEIIKSRRNLISFGLVALVGAFLLEGIINWVGKLWIYPYFDFKLHIIVGTMGLIIYWLTIIESYFAAKSVLDHYSKRTKGKNKLKLSSNEKIFFNLLGILGVIILIGTTIFLIQDFNSQDAQFSKFEDVSSKTDSYIFGFWGVLAYFFGLWFILEYIEYKEKKLSLLKDIFHKYPNPLFAIILGSLVLAFVMETTNLFHLFWEYTHLPWESVTFLGVPIMVYISWPLHYIIFLSLWRVCASKESAKIWSR